MSIQDLGSLGEFIAALATLATLVYLAVQIRKNTIAVRAGSHQAVSDCFIELNSWIAKDASLARIYRVGAESPSDLSEDERAQFNFMLLSVFHAYQTTFYHHQVGTLDDALYQPIMRDIEVVLASPGVREWWTETPFSFNPEFQRHLESKAIDIPPAAV